MYDLQGIRGNYKEKNGRGSGAEKDNTGEPSRFQKREKDSGQHIHTGSCCPERGREKDGKERKVFAFFVDLRAAFDNVNREKLWELMERWSINGNVIDRLRGIYRETMATIRTKEGLSEEIKTRKGVRQGCVLSPILFNIYIAYLDKYLEERGIGRIKIGKERIWSLAYTDDSILISKNKEAMVDMMGTLRRFLKDRKIELNVEKSKIMVFNSRGREKKRKW
jgi:hypothetical protein